MGKINILPAKVYNRIAAGEVVDRPYSVVKELVENALDAGATEIEVYIEKGGKQLVRVIDNGHGIEREDLDSVFLPHATSKISVAEDLENIVTLGFRGEAVASIASVSQMSITSKAEGKRCYRATCMGGEMGVIKEVAGENVGTDVSVGMLFFNAPVRLKFLKTDKGEETDITTYISRFILNRSDVAFTYYVDGKKVLQSFGDGDEAAMLSVYGANFLSQCLQIDAEKNGIKIRGYIGNHSFSKANRSYQNVFLNGRYVVNTTIAAAMTNAYNNYLMKRQYPVYVLHLDMPPQIVDVNVHPNKLDVRFADNQIIYGTVYSVVSAVLDGKTKALDYVVNPPTVMENEAVQEVEAEKPKQIPITPLKNENGFGFATLSYEEAQAEIQKIKPQKSTFSVDGVPFEEVHQAGENDSKGFIPNDMPLDFGLKNEYTEEQMQYIIANRNKTSASHLHKKYFPDLHFDPTAMGFKDDAVGVEPDQDYFEENKRQLADLEEFRLQHRLSVDGCTYIGKMFNTYLMYQREDEVYIIDQHAAHERIIFDKLRSDMEKREVIRQPMLVPYFLHLNAFEAEFIREQLDNLIEMGFDIRQTDATNFEVTAVPTDLRKINLSVFFNYVLGDIKQYRAIKLVDIIRDKLASTACKAAVKGGACLTKAETDQLFKMINGDMTLKCPHGRPILIVMTKTELEKKFKRIV